MKIEEIVPLMLTLLTPSQQERLKELVIMSDLEFALMQQGGEDTALRTACVLANRLAENLIDSKNAVDRLSLRARLATEENQHLREQVSQFAFEDLERRRKEHGREYARTKQQSGKCSPTIYLVSDGRGRCKIGITTNLPDRMKKFRNVIPDIKLLKTMTGTRDTERQLLKKHAAQRIGGEWFVESAAIWHDFGIDTEQSA